MLRGTARKTTNATIRGSAAYAPGQTARIQAADITPSVASRRSSRSWSSTSTCS